jgi:hypothetical protein
MASNTTRREGRLRELGADSEQPVSVLGHAAMTDFPRYCTVVVVSNAVVLY